MAKQTVNQMDGDLTAKIAAEQSIQVWESKTLEELEVLDRDILDRLDLMRAEHEKNGGSKYDVRLTDEEVKTRDKISFFKTKREFENDKVQEGDIFHTSWGYDQTNVEMYKVVGLTKSGKSAIIREIGFKTVPGSEISHGMADHVQPDPENEIKRKVYNEEKHQYEELNEAKPDLRVKIVRSSAFNPITKQHEEIGKIHLRGSVYYAGESKHLQNLYRIKSNESTYRSWYA